MGEDMHFAAENIKKAMSFATSSPFEQNLLAVIAAQSLAAGNDKAQLESICKFLQLLQAAIRSYM